MTPPTPTFAARLKRHVRLSRAATTRGPRYTPPFLIVFINSTCNLTCEHCFVWSALNKRDDLTYAEFDRLTSELGEIENLNLSGGEPFMREDFAEVVELFVRRNAAKRVYCPSNGFYPDRTEAALRKLLPIPSLENFTLELSLDGMQEFHDRFRSGGKQPSFARAMDTYDMLARLRREFPKLSIHAISTATHENLDEIEKLTRFLRERCPEMEHHNLAILRGDRKNKTLEGPALERYDALYETLRDAWRDKEKGRFGGVVDPMLHWAKRVTIDRGEQVVPCKAGRLSGVIYANGDVAFCENHRPLGNLRRNAFFEIWDSPEADRLRDAIAARRCFCTNEIFLWPSITYQPWQLAKAFAASRRWQV
ncbi:MAG TPA: radical SAM protein [Planctomycetota bacterium]|nr:radical SAM protein [Planctomycetota bacterium]